MSETEIYILHKNGAKSHYIGLKYLLDSKNIILKYREFSIASKAFKAVLKLDFHTFKKQITNLLFLLNLAFSKNKKIVLGIAPFDYKLRFLLKFLKNHQIYYHTSWASWDKSFHPKSKNLNQSVFEDWKYLLETLAVEIYAVTETSKESLLQNYDLDRNKIHVVNHSVDQEFDPPENKQQIDKSFIYVGRLLEEKGIEELLKVFSKNKKLKLSIVGDGKLKSLVESAASSNTNITYHNYISDRYKLSNLLSSHEFIILNSKRTGKWEELFGMSLIEGMAHGLIPFAPMHPGPKEIIDINTGYLFEEGNLEECLNKINSEYPEYKEKSKFSKMKIDSYKPEKIALLWQSILN